MHTCIKKQETVTDLSRKQSIEKTPIQMVERKNTKSEPASKGKSGRLWKETLKEALPPPSPQVSR